MSLSQEIVLDLLGRGMSRRGIARALDVNDRLVGFMATGAKPLDDYAPALDELRRRLAAGERPGGAKGQPWVAKPAPRVTAAGKVARVRRKRTVVTAGGSSTTMRKQATRGGGRGALHPLEAAAKAGQMVAVTVSINSRGKIVTDSDTRGRHGAGVTMKLGDARTVLQDVNQQHGGDFTAYTMERLMDAGYVTVKGDPSAAADSIELRGYSPK